MKFTCPECSAEFEVDDVIEGEIVTCPDCGIELEVILDNEKFTVKVAEKAGEDWGE